MNKNILITFLLAVAFYVGWILGAWINGTHETEYKKDSSVVCFDNRGHIMLEILDTDVMYYKDRVLVVSPNGTIDIGSAECLIFKKKIK